MASARGISDVTFEMGSLPMNGRWVWRDDTKSLEYLSNKPVIESKDLKRRGVKGGFLPQDFVKRGDRATPNVGTRTYDQNVTQRVHGLQRSIKLRQKHKGETSVTLNRVKDVAYDIMADKEIVSMPFDDLFDTAQFDTFLIYLVKYFQTFFEKRAHENKPNPMNIEPSLADVKHGENLRKQLEYARKQLGQAYCVLVLGLGLENYHHMGCGSSRVSATYTDRGMYETLYSFCTYLIWISFRRRDYDIIKTEVGNMLRSNTFNPALRVKNVRVKDEVRKKPVVIKEVAEEASTSGEQINHMIKKPNFIEPIEKIKPAEYRRMHKNRPAIKSIVQQRSPAVVAILPTPREEAAWLFRLNGTLSASSLANLTRDKMEAAEKDARVEAVSSQDKAKFKAGIIGEALSQYNEFTLTPLGADNEEVDDEESLHSGVRPSSNACNGISADESSLQQTAQSAVTTAESDGDGDGQQ